MSFEPTQEQADQAAIVQHEVVELMSKLAIEGIDWRVVLTGAGCAIADILDRNIGGAAVPRWFATMAAQTLHMKD